MGFLKKVWKDRITEYPTRRALTKTDGSSELVTVSREEGNVSQEGDAFSSENMNDLEERISAGFDEVSNLADTVPYNLIPFPYYESSHTDNGIEWTVNEDGTVTANNTATNSSEFTIAPRLGGNNPFILPAGTYTVSGCPIGGGSATYSLNVLKTSDSGTNERVALDYGNGATFTLDKETRIGVNFYVMKGQTVNNLTFEPMIAEGNEKKTYHKGFQTVYELSQAVPKGLQFRVENGKLQFRYDSEVWT